MWRAALALLLVSVVCVPAGVFLYLKRLSLMSDAMSHIVLPGIVIAYLAVGSLSGWVLLPGAAIAGILASLLISNLSSRRWVRPDAAMAIVFTTFFALGVILLSTQAKNAHIDTDCVLFGNVLGLTDESLWLLGVSGIVLSTLLIVFFRWLKISAMDAGFAASLGIPVTALHYGLMSSVSVGTVASFEAVGAILVISFFIVPAAFGRLLARSLKTHIFVAFAFSILTSLIGIYVSVYLNTSTAGAIVSVQGAVYFAGVLIDWLRTHFRAQETRVEPT